jgi:hypothetical protein
MVAQSAAAPEPTLLSRWMRDYRLSLALLIAGIVIVVAVSVFSVWANSTGNYPPSFWTGFAMNVTGTGGGMLVLLAGTVAYYHRKGLRLSEGTA